MKTSSLLGTCCGLNTQQKTKCSEMPKSSEGMGIFRHANYDVLHQCIKTVLHTLTLSLVVCGMATHPCKRCPEQVHTHGIVSCISSLHHAGSSLEGTSGL